LAPLACPLYQSALAAEVIDRVNRTALSMRAIAEPAGPQDLNALELVGCAADSGSRDPHRR
jgi:hypothetical protein